MFISRAMMSCLGKFFDFTSNQLPHPRHFPESATGSTRSRDDTCTCDGAHTRQYPTSEDFDRHLYFIAYARHRSISRRLAGAATRADHRSQVAPQLALHIHSMGDQVLTMSVKTENSWENVRESTEGRFWSNDGEYLIVLPEYMASCADSYSLGCEACYRDCDGRFWFRKV